MMPSTWDLIETLRSDCTLPIDSITRGTSCWIATATWTGTAGAAEDTTAASRLHPDRRTSAKANGRTADRRELFWVMSTGGFLRDGVHVQQVLFDVQQVFHQGGAPRRGQAPE